MASIRHIGVALAALSLGGVLATGGSALASSQPPTATVSGTSWVEVSNAAELLYIDANQGQYLTSNILLTGNVTLAGAPWVPLGASGAPFAGTFNGQGYTVSDYQVVADGPDVGFFGDVAGTAGSAIENLAVTGSVSASGVALGGLIGDLQSGQVTNAYASGSVSASNGFANAGGLVGAEGSAATIQDSAASGAVSGQNNSAIGGLVGLAQGTISASYAAGNVTTAGAFSGVGGLVGWVIGTVQNTYATGSVTGVPSDQVGGLVASLLGGTVEDSYAVGSLGGTPANTTVGGFLGGNDAPYTGTVDNAFFLATPGLAGSGQGTLPITGETSAALTTGATYAAWPNFSSVWGISPGINHGYPYLLDVLTASTSPAVPALLSQTVTVNGVTTSVIGNLGQNLSAQIANGDTVGYVEERAAILAGASYGGEGTASAYMSDILSGAGLGQQTHVTAVEQGQYAALYQKLGIIPTWSGGGTSMSSGLEALIQNHAPTLAIENYLVQLFAFTWPGAIAQAQAGFPLQHG